MDDNCFPFHCTLTCTPPQMTVHPSTLLVVGVFCVVQGIPFSFVHPPPPGCLAWTPASCRPVPLKVAAGGGKWMALGCSAMALGHIAVLPFVIRRGWGAVFISIPCPTAFLKRSPPFVPARSHSCLPSCPRNLSCRVIIATPTWGHIVSLCSVIGSPWMLQHGLMRSTVTQRPKVDGATPGMCPLCWSIQSIGRSVHFVRCIAPS